MASAKPPIHGRDHAPGGADPIPAIPSASSVIGCSVGLHNAVTVTAGTSPNISWDTLIEDSSGGTMWAAGAPTNLVAPVSGFYLSTLRLGFTGVASNYPSAYVLENANHLHGVDTQLNDAAATSFVYLNVSVVFQLTAGQHAFAQLVNPGPGSIVLQARASAFSYVNQMTFTYLG